MGRKKLATHPTLRRIRELRDNAPEGDVESLPQEKWDELGRLEAEWEKIALASAPILTCCPAAKRYPAVLFVVDFDNEDSDEEGKYTSGHWEAATHERASSRIRMQEPRCSPWYEEMPHARFCPWCGTTAPQMRLKEKPPSDICRPEGGYCMGCGERLQGCNCLPVSAAFEPSAP